jgi:ABC-type bacteriocin/lantibiotic exporter with double-glycine peptidase domain
VQVMVDGVPLKELDIKWFRKQLGVVSQVIYLLTVTIIVEQCIREPGELIFIFCVVR